LEKDAKYSLQKAFNTIFAAMRVAHDNMLYFVLDALFLFLYIAISDDCSHRYLVKRYIEKKSEPSGK
jgi:hypothetical protein